jgi:hypothetical protein
MRGRRCREVEINVQATMQTIDFEMKTTPFSSLINLFSVTLMIFETTN